jgi:thiol-disulfide isomerase/thioredoxin
MRFILSFSLPVLALFSLSCASFAQTNKPEAGLPKDPKAQNTYAEGLDWLKHHDQRGALGAFKKADRQDGGRCVACQNRIIELGEKIGDYKSADEAALEMIEEAQTPAGKTEAHMQRGIVLLHEGSVKSKEEAFAEAEKEFKTVLADDPKYSSAYYADGLALGHLKQDDAAKAQFQQFLQIEQQAKVERARAARYIEKPELIRARMAPAFAATTIDGKQISLDELAGKVVLLDFWATWCGPCREALPHMRKIAQKFAGEPLVILSVSLDTDANDQKWRTFVAQNQMTWLQVRDSGWTGPLATRFGVNAIPHTFTIDADGVLQDEHIGDGSIEGKLRKLCGEARKLQEGSRQDIAAK